MTVTARGFYSSPVDAIRNMLAASAAFQKVVQATNSTQALGYIIAFGQDSDQARPFAMVNLDDDTRSAFSGGARDFFLSKQRVSLAIELPTTTTGTVTSATTNTGFISSGLANYADDHFNGLTCAFTSGALNGQSAAVSDFDGTTGAVTLATGLTGTPAAAAAFKIYGSTATDAMTHFMNVVGDIVEDLEELSGTGGYASFSDLALEAYGRPERDKEQDNYCGALIKGTLK